jgi:hypothetical protein
MLHRLRFPALLALAAALIALGIVSSGGAADAAAPSGQPTAFSMLGLANVQGEAVVVDVVVAVQPGQNAREVARAALQGQGARPFDSTEFSTTGLVWNQFSDSVTTNDFVTQNYNPGNAPTGAAQTALTNTHATWTNVTTSRFAFQFGGTTTRCPSLVRECDGPQFFDGFNDVAWLRLGGCCTLGVTWFSTSTDEADMALNTNFTWNTNGQDFDAETVFLHENGHVVGLGHSDVAGAVMEPVYAGVRRALHQDDINGVSALYPASTTATTGTITGTVTSSATNSAISGATVSTDTGQSTTTAANGTYTLTAVPTGSRTVTASATGFGSASQVVSVTDGGTATANFSLAPATTGTTVSVSSITYATTGGKTGDLHLLITVALVDNLGNPVSGASVSIDVFRNSSLYGSGTGTTGTAGTVTFQASKAPSGTYTTTVTAVSAAGLTWDGVTPPNSFTK